MFLTLQSNLLGFYIAINFAWIFLSFRFITKSLHESEKGPSLSSRSFIFAILIVFNFGLLIVDRILFLLIQMAYGIKIPKNIPLFSPVAWTFAGVHAIKANIWPFLR